MSPSETDPPLQRRQIAGVILAGGLARRMGGGDKSLLELDGQPMLARVVARLKPQVGTLALNANGDPARFAHYRLPVIADATQRRDGPLAGILAGLAWAAAQPGVRALVTVSCDTPFLPLDLVPRLAAEGAVVSVAASGGRLHPTAALWPLQIAPQLAAALAEGRRKAMAFVEAAGARPVSFAVLGTAAAPIDPFFNANTPEDLDAARAMLQTSPR